MPSFSGWLGKALRPCPPARGRRPYRPAVEALEARDVPTTVAVQPVTAKAGNAFTGLLAVITDPNPLADSVKLQVQVDYGDGSGPQDATVVAENTPGVFDVRGNHTYAHDGTFTLNLSVYDRSTFTWTYASGAATVAANAGLLPTTGVNISASAGRQFSGVVAVVQDPDNGAQASNLQVSIDWGDGSGLTTASVRPSVNPGFFEVTGNHTYLLSGTDTVRIWVQDTADGNTNSATATATVAAPPTTLTVSAVAVNATSGTSYSAVVAVVHDTNPNASAQNLSAVVDWGDGSGPATVAVQATGTPGFFQVLANHTYSQAGSGQLKVWVQDNLDGMSAQDVSQTSVTAGTPTPSPTPAPAQPLTLTPQQRGFLEWFAWASAVMRRHHHLHLRMFPLLRAFGFPVRT